MTKHTTARYPGWIWEKTISGGREEWFGTKAGIGYAIAAFKTNTGFTGELLSRQTRGGRINWELCKNSFDGEVSNCVAEAEKRAAYWQSKGSSDVYGEKLKLIA